MNARQVFSKYNTYSPLGNYKKNKTWSYEKVLLDTEGCIIDKVKFTISLAKFLHK